VPGEQPAKQGGPGHDFRQQLIAERVQLDDRRRGGNDTIVGERGMNATPGQLTRDERHVARGRTHDDADIGLVGAHMS
jgi:hypothetical protein